MEHPTLIRQERSLNDESDQALLESYNRLLVADAHQFALGQPEGHYIRRKEPFSAEIRQRMLARQLSVALYMLTPEGKAIQGVVDSDQDDGLAQMQRLGFKLRELGLQPLLEGSRRGGHIRIFHEPIAPSVTTLLLHKTMSNLHIEAEIFPRGRGLSCVRALFSIHPRTRQQYPLLDLETLEPVADTLIGQLEYLATFEQTRAEDLAQALATMVVEEEKLKRATKGHLTVNEKPDILEVVGRDLEIKKVGKYYRSICPFHQDTQPSLVIYPETGTFYCFGCQKTGDVIHYMALRQGVRDGEIISRLRKTQN